MYYFIYFLKKKLTIHFYPRYFQETRIKFNSLFELFFTELIGNISKLMHVQ